MSTDPTIFRIREPEHTSNKAAMVVALRKIAEYLDDDPTVRQIRVDVPFPDSRPGYVFAVFDADCPPDDVFQAGFYFGDEPDA